MILRCLARDPAARYQSAAEVLQNLDAMHAEAPRAASKNNTISIQVPKPSRRSWMVLAAMVVGAVALLPGWRSKAIQYRIAVLPLNIGDAKELKYVVDGVQDALAAKLGALGNVYVADLASIPPAARADNAKLAKDYGVTVVIRGTLQSAAERVSVRLRGEDLGKKQALLNEKFPGVRADLLTLEDRIFNSLAEKLVLRQSREKRRGPRRTRRRT